MGIVYHIVEHMRSHPHAFLASKLDLPLAFKAGPNPKQFRYAMTDWPDAAALKSMLRDLHGAFLKMWAAWEALPENGRRSLQGSAPPAELSLI